MTAYELANNFNKAYEVACNEGALKISADPLLLKKTANMLRQQAKEKELLQNQSSELAKEVMYFQEQNRQQANTIEELKQQIWTLQNTLTNRTLRTYDGKLE